MDERDPLTGAVIGAAIEVHRIMGPGLLESVYQLCLEHELTLRGMTFQPQARRFLEYKGKVFDDEFLKLDIYFPRQLVVELKAVERMHPVHEAQLLTYLRPDQNTRRPPHQFQRPRTEGRHQTDGVVKV